MRMTFVHATLMVGLGAGALGSPDALLAAAPATAPRETAATAPMRQTGTLIGVVRDALTGQPIPNAYVRLRELGRNELSHGDGSFHFLRLAPRTYTVLAQRLGYAPVEIRVEVPADRTVQVVLEMEPSALEIAGIVVTGTGRERRAGETFRPTTVLGDAELRRRLDTTSLAATIAHVPGISQASYGPAAAQPVIRGMGGDRVLVLEDGQRTGDLATTAADHPVTIDPMGAKRIEIVRGPAGLMYGSNALGGVVNVVREDVPRTLPEQVAGSLSVQAQSVNRGATGAGWVVVPHGRFAVRGEVSGRTAGDSRTPLGPLPSSDLRSVTAGLGTGWVASWGYVGAAYRDFDMEYGVPGEFQGELIPGAHPGGIDSFARRRSGKVEAGHFLGFGPISSASFDANYVHHTQREVEAYLGDREILGASFQNQFGSANLVLRHEHELDPIFTEGAFGFFASARQLRTAGGFTGTRDASTLGLAAYAFEELELEPFRFQIGGRYDWNFVRPDDRRPIRMVGREIPVAERTFGSASASAAALVEPRRGFVIGASIARAFRTPSVEELFSDGPHLADYSYDIGNPELDAEFGFGGDLFLRITRARLQAEATLFRNELRNYIYHAPTGELDPRFHRFAVFEARSTDAVFQGGELTIQVEAVRRVVVDGSLSLVRAERRDTNEPLPAIPPLNGQIGARYESPAFFLSAVVDGAAAQHRVQPPIPSPVGDGIIHAERPTAGYSLLNVGAGWRGNFAGRLHTVTVQVDNATDAVWREHLSRIKDVAPQPGRNVQLLYRVHF
jgi:iron complex outermembrane recepter protein